MTQARRFALAMAGGRPLVKRTSRSSFKPVSFAMLGIGGPRCPLDPKADVL
jgi:hypothetical protein